MYRFCDIFCLYSFTLSRGACVCFCDPFFFIILMFLNCSFRCDLNGSLCDVQMALMQVDQSTFHGFELARCCQLFYSFCSVQISMFIYFPWMFIFFKSHFVQAIFCLKRERERRENTHEENTHTLSLSSAKLEMFLNVQAL